MKVRADRFDRTVALHQAIRKGLRVMLHMENSVPDDLAALLVEYLEEGLMAKIDDLNTGLGRIGAALDGLGKRISALEAKVGSGGDLTAAQEDSVVQGVNALADTAEGLVSAGVPPTPATVDAAAAPAPEAPPQ